MINGFNYVPLKDWISRNQGILFLVLAFLIPLLVRTIPEILMGPYITGFDTLGFYVPNTLIWLHGGFSLWGFLSTAPLFYTIFMSLVAVGGSLVFVIKIISPILLGFLGLSIFVYARKGLCWSFPKSSFVAFLGTLYFVALRASWDQLREELGLVLFFVVLTLLLTNKKGGSWKNYIPLSLAMMAVVLSHQLMSVLMLGVIVFNVAYNLFHKDFIKSIRLIATSLPAILYFILIYLAGVTQSGFLNYSTNVGSPLLSWTGFTSYQSMLTSVGGFFFYCFVPLLPFIVVGLWRFKNLQLRSWFILSLILMLLPLASVSPYRWVLLLTYPFAFFATDALSGLKSIKRKPRLKFSIYKIAILYLVLSTAILSFGFIFMTSENPFFYYNPNYLNKYPYQIPTSMLQNTVSVIDCHDTLNSLQWFKNNVNSSGLLLSHTVFYGWALLELNESRVRSYGFDNPVNATISIAQEGHIQLYLIWWVRGQGWYAQPTLPTPFQEVYHSGRIAIYSYQPI